MVEIGGYFGFEQLISKEYYKKLARFNTGRNALIYFLKTNKVKKIYLPYYLCDSVSNACEAYGFEYEYYQIDTCFMPAFDKQLNKNEYLLVVNYYGQLSDKNIKRINKKYKQIILDNTHAFYQKPIKKISTFYSCRKYFGVSDGAYLYSSGATNSNYPLNQSFTRMAHILGRYEVNAREYYNDYLVAEKKMAEEPIQQMSNLTKNILGAIDYKLIAKKRLNNYKVLDLKLKKINNLDIRTPVVPFAYPLHLENGQEVREKLISKGIFIPILWPNVIEQASSRSLEYDFSKNILPLPCDQRYNQRDMEYIAKNILNIER